MANQDKATFAFWRYNRKLEERCLSLGPGTTVQNMLDYRDFVTAYPSGMTLWNEAGDELNPNSLLTGGNIYHIKAKDRNSALRERLESVRHVYWDIVKRGEKRKRDEIESEGWHILVFPQATRVGQDGRFQEAESKGGYWVLSRESFGPLETVLSKLLFDEKPKKDQYLLHGPAGTGKSHFVVSLANKLIREAHERAGNGGDQQRYRVICLLDCTLLQENFEATVLESLAITYADDDLAIDKLCQIETFQELVDFITLFKAITLAILDQYQVAETDRELASKLKKLFLGELLRILYVTSAGSTQIKELVKSSHKYYERVALPSALSENDLLAWNLVLGTQAVVTEPRHRERLELLGNNPLFLREWYNVCRELGANVPSFEGVTEEALREALLKAKELAIGFGAEKLGAVGAGGSQKRARLESSECTPTGSPQSTAGAVSSGREPLPLLQSAVAPTVCSVEEAALGDCTQAGQRVGLRVEGSPPGTVGTVDQSERAGLPQSPDSAPGAAPAGSRLGSTEYSRGKAFCGKLGPEGKPPGTPGAHSSGEREVQEELDMGCVVEQKQGRGSGAADAETRPSFAGQGVAGGVGAQSGVAQDSLGIRSAFVPSQSAGEERPDLSSLHLPEVAPGTAVAEGWSDLGGMVGGMGLGVRPGVGKSPSGTGGGTDGFGGREQEDPDFNLGPEVPLGAVEVEGLSQPADVVGDESLSSVPEAGVQSQCPSFEECWAGFLDSEIMNLVYMDLQDNLARATADGVRNEYLQAQRALLLKTGFVKVDLRYVNGKYFVFGKKLETAMAASDAVKLVIAQFLEDVSDGGLFFSDRDVTSALNRELKSAQHPAVAGVLAERALLAKLCQGSGRSSIPVAVSNAAPKVMTFDTGEEEYVAEELFAELERSLALGRKEVRIVVKPKSVAYRFIDYVHFLAVWEDPDATTEQPASDLPSGSGQGRAEVKPSAGGGRKKKKKKGAAKEKVAQAESAGPVAQGAQAAPATGAGKAGRQRGKGALRLKEYKVYITFGQVSLMKFEAHVFSSNIMHEELALKWMASGLSREQVEFGIVYVLPEGRLPDAPERNCWKDELNRPLRYRTVVGMVPHRQICLSFSQFDPLLKEVDKWPERWAELFR